MHYFATNSGYILSKGITGRDRLGPFACLCLAFAVLWHLLRRQFAFSHFAPQPQRLHHPGTTPWNPHLFPGSCSFCNCAFAILISLGLRLSLVFLFLLCFFFSVFAEGSVGHIVSVRFWTSFRLFALDKKLFWAYCKFHYLIFFELLSILSKIKDFCNGFSFIVF